MMNENYGIDGFTKKEWQQPTIEVISKDEIEHNPGSPGPDGGPAPNSES